MELEVVFKGGSGTDGNRLEFRPSRNQRHLSAIRRANEKEHTIGGEIRVLQPARGELLHGPLHVGVDATRIVPLENSWRTQELLVTGVRSSSSRTTNVESDGQTHEVNINHVT